MTVVIDSSVLINVALGEPWQPRDRDLIAPHLIDSEILATLRRLERGAVVPGSDIDFAVSVTDEWAVRRYGDLDLRRRSLDVARRLGWARTYDAEYVALAERENLVLVTDDARLRRGASRLVRTAAPQDA